MQKLRTILSVVILGGICSSVGHADQIFNENHIMGHTDTPYLPWAPDYRKHDADRPLPAFVETGDEPVTIEAPEDAVVLFDGSDIASWVMAKEGWQVDEGELVAGAGYLTTTQAFGSAQYHIEFMTPDEEPDRFSNRGNNGVVLMGKYEIQIFDSHPMHKKQVYADGQCAAIYGETPPLVNATRKPGVWQTYDIFFQAPVFKGGKLVKQPRVTVLHNGVLVHLNTPIRRPTGWKEIAEVEVHAKELPLSLGGHGSPVRFRNIWVRPL